MDSDIIGEQIASAIMESERRPFSLALVDDDTAIYCLSRIIARNNMTPELFHDLFMEQEILNIVEFILMIEEQVEPVNIGY